jgi:hypothetical protein
MSADTSGGRSDANRQSETGQVTIRFSKPPIESLLDRIGQKHDLVVLRRNEFNPAQIVAAQRDGCTTPLANVCDDLRQEPEVEDAWPNTASMYTRAEDPT